MIYLDNCDPPLKALFEQEGIPLTEDRNEAVVFIRLVNNQLVIGSRPESIPRWNNFISPVKFLTVTSDTYFRNLRLIDINCPCEIPQNANIGSTDRGSPFAYWNGTDLLIIPYRRNRMLKHRGSRPKKFYFEHGKYPDESVALVDRGGIRRFLSSCLKMFLNRHGLPYIHLSYVPANHRSVFGFRVDTDYTPTEIMEECVAIPRGFHMSWTWFLMTAHITPEMNKLPIILSDQDTQLHCHEHIIYPDLNRNISNYFNGLKKLELMGIKPSGVAAPYGEWNLALNAAFTRLEFAYSSEFCYAYDDLPSRPLINGSYSKVLQIPVHPISIGRLIAAGMDEDEMIEYYKNVIDLQAARNEPCFLYDHPLTIIKFSRVIREIVKYGLDRCGGWISMTGYCRWWTNREQAKFGCRVKNDYVEIETRAENPELELVMELNGLVTRVPYKTGRYYLPALNWTPAEKIPNPADIAKIRDEPLVWKLKHRLRLWMRRYRDFRILKEQSA